MELVTRSPSRSAIRKVRSQGFALSDSPGGQIPQIPADITGMHIEELMQMFSEYGAWLDFIDVQLAAALIDEKEAESVLDQSVARATMAAKGKSVTEAKAAAVTADTVLTAKDTYLDLYGYRKIIETLHGKCDRGRSLLSRELSRRISG